MGTVRIGTPGFDVLPPAFGGHGCRADATSVTGGTPVVPFDARAGEWLGVERARLEVAGTPVDLVIAATAAVNQLVVVTADLRHFERLRVAVEDWTVL